MNDPKIDLPNIADFIQKNSCGVYVYFHLSDIYDEKRLKDECKKQDLDLKILDVNGLIGLIRVSLSLFPCPTDLEAIEKEIRTRFKYALTETLRDSDNRKRIAQSLDKTQYIEHFCKLITIVNRRIREGKETIDRLKNSMKRYEAIIGEEGINLFIKIFSENKEQAILGKYSSFSDFVLKKYQIEIFISQQINKIYLTIIYVDPELIIQGTNAQYHLNISGLANYDLVKITWRHPFITCESDMYKCVNPPHILVIPDKYPTSNRANDTLIFLKLCSNNVCAGIEMIKYLLEQDKSIIADEVDDIPLKLRMVISNLVNASPKEIEESQELLVASQNTLTSLLLDFHKPISREFDKYMHMKGRYDNLIENQMKKTPVKFGGAVVSVVNYNLPDTLGIITPSREISYVLTLLKEDEGNIIQLLDAYTKLNQYLQEYKHIAKMREVELSEAKQKELKEKENRIFAAINNLLSIIVNALKILKPHP